MKSPGGHVAVDNQFGVGIPPRQEVRFRDGTAVWLNRINGAGAPDLFLRELGQPAPGVQVDLRLLAPELGTDLPLAATRDVPGLVHFSLRQRFGGVQDLLQAAVAGGRVA